MKTAADQRLRRIMLAVLLAVIALPVLAFAGLCVWLNATQGRPPALFADVPQDFRDEAPWTARMVATFPAGTPEAVVIERLKADGFEVDQTARSATYGWGNGVPCVYTVQAAWSAQDGRVTTATARYGNACW